MAIEIIKVTEEDISVTLTDVGIRGRAGLVFRGDWDIAVQYYQGDAVRYTDNNVYIATGTPSLGTTPVNTAGDENTGWSLLVTGSQTLDSIIEIRTQSVSTDVNYESGDLIVALNGDNYWALTDDTLTGTTDLTDTSKFEERGYQPMTATSGLLSARPTSGTNVGDVYITASEGSFIWSGSAWLTINPQIVSTTENGLMLSADKTKLDTIETSADKNDKVTVDFSGSTITVNSREDRADVTDTASIPDASDITKGLATVDASTLKVSGGEISADETLDFGKLKNITDPTTGESGFTLRGINDGSNVSYDWTNNVVDTSTIQQWDDTGLTGYSENTTDLGSSIIEFNDRLYLAVSNINYETEGSCSVIGITNRTQCTDGVNNGTWTLITPEVDVISATPKWNLIGPGLLEQLDDVDTSVAEGDWSTDHPILARVGDEWRLFPGLDKLDNVGDIPTPLSSQEGYVLRTDGAGTYTWANQVARIQDFETSSDYIAGDLVRSEDRIFLAVSTNIITASSTLPTDGSEWQAVGPERVEDLQNANITNPNQGDIFTFDGTQWRNLSASAGLALAIDLTDIGDIPGNSITDKVLVSNGNIGGTGDRYTWEDYGRNIKNIQPYDASTSYLGDDLVQHNGDIYISLNSVSATAPAPTGVNSDTNWNQIGASTLTHIDDVPEPTTVGSVLSYTGEVDGADTFGWTSSIETAARVPAFASNEAYAEGSLVTTGTGANLAVFIALKAVAASTTVPTDDGINWEILGPERMSNLEDVSLITLGDNEILQFNTTTNVWENKTPAEFGGDMILANIGDVTSPVSGTDNNRVLQAVFTSGVVTYGWVDRTTNTTTIQAHSTTKSYSSGEIVYHDNSVFLAIGTAANLNRVPGAAGSESFWQIIGPETFEELEDSAIVSPTTDQFIIYNGTNWINTDLVTETEKLVDLFNLKDVDGTAVTNNVLRFDGTNWVPVTPASLAGNMNSGELNDIDLTTEAVVENDLLQRDSNGVWVPKSTAELAAQINLEEFKNVQVEGTNISSGDFIQKDSNGNYEPVDASGVGAQITAENLLNIADSVGNDELLQKNSSDDNYTGKSVSNLLGQGTIDDLDDVTLGTLGDNEILQRKSGDWVNSTPATVAGNMLLSNIGDVNGDPTDGHISVGDGDSWESTNITTATESNVKLVNLNDVAYGELPNAVGENFDGTRTPILIYKNGSWGVERPSDLVGITALESLRNVADPINNGSFIQKSAGGLWSATQPFEIGEQIKLGDIEDVTSPSTGENGFVLRGLSRATTLVGAIVAGDFTSITVGSTTGFSDSGSVELPGREAFAYTSKTDTTFVNTTAQTLGAQPDGAAISQVLYQWVSNNQETASIQAWDTNTTYTAGDLVEYAATGGELKIYIARVGSVGVQPLGVTASETNWELLGPESIEQLNGVSISAGAVNDLLQRTGTDTWANVTPAVMAEAGIALGNLSNVTDPISNEDGFVLRANNNSGTITYDWVSNTQDTATIQAYSALNTYTVGHLVSHDGTIYLALKVSSPNDNDPSTPATEVIPGTDETTWETVGPESIEKLVGVSISSGADGDLLQRTGTDTWENITPASMTQTGVDLFNLKDVNGTPVGNSVIRFDGSNWSPVSPNTLLGTTVLQDIFDIGRTNPSFSTGDILQRTNLDWEYISLAEATNNATTGSRIRDLNDVPDTDATADQILIRNEDADGWEYTNLSNASKEASGGIRVRDLSDVDVNETPGDNTLLQFDSVQGHYDPQNTDEVLKTGHLESLDRVPDSPDLTTGASSDLGKVLTVRRVAVDGTNVPNYVWEAPRQASIQLFSAGTTADPVTYAIGDLSFTNDTNGQRIWIATEALDSSAETSKTLPSPELDSRWDLVGPETIADLNDTAISTGVTSGDLLRYDGTTWKDVSFAAATVTGDTLAVSFDSGNDDITATVDATGFTKGDDFNTASSARTGDNLSVKFDTTESNGAITSVTGTVDVGDIHSTTTADGRFLHEDSNWDGNVAYTTNDIVTSAGALWRVVRNTAISGTIVPAYNVATTYNPNDIVTHDSRLWRFDKANAGTGDTPSDSSTDWASHTITNRPESDTTSSDWIKFMQTGDEGVSDYRDNVTYASNDLVAYTDGVVYVANGIPTGNPSTGTNWLPIASSTQFARATALAANANVVTVEGTTDPLIITELEIQEQGFAKTIDIGIIDIPGVASITVDDPVGFQGSFPAGEKVQFGRAVTLSTSTAKVDVTLRQIHGQGSLAGIEFTLFIGAASQTFTMVGNHDYFELDFTGLATGTELGLSLSGNQAAIDVQAHITVVITHGDDIIVKRGVKTYLDTNYASFTQGATADTAVQPADFGTETVTGDDVAVQFTSVTDSVTGKIDLSAHPSTETIVEETVDVGNAVDYVVNTRYAINSLVGFTKSGGNLPLYYRQVANPVNYRGDWVAPTTDASTEYDETDLVSYLGLYYDTEIGQALGEGGTNPEPPTAVDGDGELIWDLADINPASNSNVWKFILSPVSVIDNLTSTDTRNALSANQGRVLNSRISGSSFTQYSTGVAYSAGNLIWNITDDKIYRVTAVITAAANTAFSDLTVTELSPGVDTVATPNDTANSVSGTSGLMSADDKEQMDDLPDTWLTGTTYVIGAQASLGGTIYRSLGNTNTGNNPIW